MRAIKHWRSDDRSYRSRGLGSTLLSVDCAGVLIVRPAPTVIISSPAW